MGKFLVFVFTGFLAYFSDFFQAYDTSKSLIFALTPNRTSETLSVGELAAAGFLSAVPTTLVTAPVERAKVLLQVRYFTPESEIYSDSDDRFKDKAVPNADILVYSMSSGICTRRVGCGVYSVERELPWLETAQAVLRA